MILLFFFRSTDPLRINALSVIETVGRNRDGAFSHWPVRAKREFYWAITGSVNETYGLRLQLLCAESAPSNHGLGGQFSQFQAINISEMS